MAEDKKADEFKPGDKVKWKSHGGEAHGHVEKKLTADTKIKSHQVRASEDDPQYLVKSDSGSGEAAHKPAALTRE
jgi:uncharacterized protein YijF (DUF1287 family)